METRNRPSRTARNTVPTKRPATSSMSSLPNPKTRSKQNNSTLPIEGHRAVASFVLALLMAFTLLAPLSYSAPDVAPLLTPRIDGSGSVIQASSGGELERLLFPYDTFIERTQASSLTTWPDASAALHFDPSDVRARRAIVGQIYAASSGNLNAKIKDTGLQIIPSAELLQDLASIYSQFLSDPEREARGVNGLASLLLVRSLNAEGVEREQLEAEAVSVFREAVNQEGNKSWQFVYNWALASLLVGDYGQCYEAMRLLATTTNAAEENELLPPFWAGLAALRLGDPGTAIVTFTQATEVKPRPGGNEAYEKLFAELRSLSLQGLGDAQWANRNPSGAYQTYYNNLLLGTADYGLYSKWVRLGLEQRAYEKLASDMAALAGSSNFKSDARIHHDRARLLDLLGRRGEAESEYKQAMVLGENDPPLLISYGQALESRGDHDGALFYANEALSRITRDATTADLSSVARAVTTQTTSLADRATAQQNLDANLLRARAWGKQNNTGAVESLTQRIVQNAGDLSPEQVALLHLYAGFANESAGLASRARDSYSAAWERLKGAAPDTVGRGAALAGLARATALGGNVSDALKVLADNGYDPVALAKGIASDPAAPDILAQGAQLLRQAGQRKEAANVLRVASVVRNLRDVRSVSGVGRTIWAANSTSVPAGLALDAADAIRTEGADGGLVVARYKQAFSLNPALAPAWNNLGVFYAQNGNPDLARFYLQSATIVSPSYAWGQQNLSTFAYKQGIGNFFVAEDAQGDVIKSVGPRALSWGHDLRYDQRGSVPSPALPPTDFLSRLPALLLLLLLLLHTLIGSDRLTNRMGVLPARSLLGRLGLLVDAQAKTAVPSLITPHSDMRSLLITLAIPSLIGMLALAWGTSGGSLEVFLLYLPVALLASIIAFGGNELAQRMAARARNSYTMHHNWVLGVILGVLSIPFGFVYGWQTVTRIQPVSGSGQGDGVRFGKARGTRTTEERELLEESQIEAAADEGSNKPLALSEANGEAVTVGVPSSGIKMPSKSWIGGNPAVSIMVAGLLLNLAIALLAGIAYWFTGWPSMRIITFASVLVLAFTSVSDPPADGWTLYRRNPPLWLALFVFASVLATLLAARII